MANDPEHRGWLAVGATVSLHSDVFADRFVEIRGVPRPNRTISAWGVRSELIGRRGEIVSVRGKKTGQEFAVPVSMLRRMESA